MVDQNELINIYINRIIKEVEELTKVKLLNEARIQHLEATLTKLQAENKVEEKAEVEAEKKPKKA